MEALKPGFLVQCTVSKILINGLYVKFMKYFEGTFFVDHLILNLSQYKKGQKVCFHNVYLE